MAKLISVALLGLMAALLLVADASIVRTTITTTEIEEDNPRGSQSQQQCPEQIRGKQFNSCQRYLSQSSSTPYDILRVVDVNPSITLQQCCEELKNLQNPQCSCEALKKIIRQESQQQGSARYGGQQQEMRQMLQKARSIPQQCDLGIRSCHFQEY
uniref:Bifunctional inhibitor/plant lipid transfer protein/seed storage helical domain-containing protein n=1 Tax=Kalanchoe fedtschenkoi TaxID=63787 RepID=A0A7N0V9Y1_KALFE